MTFFNRLHAAIYEACGNMYASITLNRIFQHIQYEGKVSVLLYSAEHPYIFTDGFKGVAAVDGRIILTVMGIAADLQQIEPGLGQGAARQRGA